MLIDADVKIELNLNELKVIYDALGATTTSGRAFEPEKELVFDDVYKSIGDFLNRELWQISD